jgi:hypothetical protein
MDRLEELTRKIAARDTEIARLEILVKEMGFVLKGSRDAHANLRLQIQEAEKKRWEEKQRRREKRRAKKVAKVETQASPKEVAHLRSFSKLDMTEVE